MGLFRRRQPRYALPEVLAGEFGEHWPIDLPQRLLEAVWDGDARALESDARRVGRAIEISAPPDPELAINLDFLNALYTAGLRWTQVSHRDDPTGDVARCHEIPTLLRELVEVTLRTAAVRAGSKGDAMIGWWISSAADLIVRAVRFRDGNSTRVLAQELEELPEMLTGVRRLPQATVPRATVPQGEVSPPVAPPLTHGSYLRALALAASELVNGVSESAQNAQDCMELIRRRYGGEYPFATAMRAAMVAIRTGDQETLRELADLTAAAGDEDSPVRVLHSLVLAGEKVLYGRAAG